MSLYADPLNANISLIAAAGGDYSNLVDWEAATDNDLVTATAGEVAAVRGVVPVTTSCIVSGATTNSSYFRLIRPEKSSDPSGGSDEGLFDQATAQPLFYNASYAAISCSTNWVTIITISENNGTVEGLQFKTTQHVFSINSNNSSARVANILIDANNNHVARDTPYVFTAFSMTAVNIFARIAGDIQVALRSTYGGGYINSAAISADGDIYQDNGFKCVSGTAGSHDGCWASGFAILDFHTSISSGNNNASSDTSAPGSTVEHSITIADCVENTASDFRIKSGSVFIDAAVAKAAALTDIYGVSRGSASDPCEIGPAQYVAAGGGSIQPQLMLLGVGS